MEEKDNYFGACTAAYVDALWDGVNYLANFTPPREEKRKDEEQEKKEDEKIAEGAHDRGS